jgi:hypothetical protein
MKAGIASKKIAIWGSILTIVLIIGTIAFTLLAHNQFPQYEDLPTPLLILSGILGLVAFASPVISILLGIFGLFGEEKKSAAFGIIYSIVFVSIMACLSWYGQQPKGIESNPGSVELTKIPENPHMFVSSDYGFGIIFPNGDPEEIAGEGMGAEGKRYQFLDETEDNPIVYSITTIRGPGVPEGLEVGHILSSTADMSLKVDKAESYKETKKFMKWGTYDVLFYDSHFPDGDERFPKRSMLLMREDDGVMFILSVVSAVKTDLNEKLQNFASTLVLMKQ